MLFLHDNNNNNKKHNLTRLNMCLLVSSVEDNTHKHIIFNQ